VKASGEAEAEVERGILCAARGGQQEEDEANRRPGFDVGDGFYLGHFDCPGSRRGSSSLFCTAAVAP